MITANMVIYRVRKEFDDIKSQKGAFFILENAIQTAKRYGCNVYDNNKNCIWNFKENNEWR